MPDKNKQYAVIGYPIAHSLSPRIHNFIKDELQESFTYRKIAITPGDLSDFIISCRSGHLAGFNVTLPHKEKILPLLDEIDPLARKTGAVNTVILKNGILKGYNTDITGCHEALTRTGVKQILQAVIIGAGGAARAAVATLLQMGCTEITLLNRSLPGAEKIRTDFSNQNLTINCQLFDGHIPPPALSAAAVIINATPVGMWPKTEESPLPDLEQLNTSTIVLDMVPNPPITHFLLQAAEKGCKVISGLDMLIGQAISAEEIWLGYKLPSHLFESLKKFLKKNLTNNKI